MTIISHRSRPIHQTHRIRTRILVSERDALQTTIWEQWLLLESFIPLHYHEVEETLIFLKGKVTLTIDDRTEEVCAPATVVIKPRQIHGLRPATSEEVHLLAVFPSASPLIYTPDGALRSLPWEDDENHASSPPEG